MFPHYLFLFLKPSLKEQHLGGWWAKAWPPGSQMGFTQIAAPTELYLEAMLWLVSTQFYLLCGVGDQTQGIAQAHIYTPSRVPSPYLHLETSGPARLWSSGAPCWQARVLFGTTLRDSQRPLPQGRESILRN